MSDISHILSPDQEILILKWIVHEGSQISTGSVLCLYQFDRSEKVQRLKNTDCGTVQKILYKEGEVVPKKSPLLELLDCKHTTIIKDLCADCGADLQQIDIASSSKASVPMIHSVPELKVSEELAKKLGRADTDRLLNDRKLVLLVDLDQTLIHTTNDNVPNNLKDVYHFQLYGPNSPWYHTRLRPGTINFLKTIDPLYELHICTFGARNYAHMICAFLDENGRLFSHRILSRDECLNATSKKDNLKALFPDDCGDAMVCIIDDREDVWNHATNLIQVKPYHFFQHTGDINAPPGLAKRELDGKGVDFNKMKLKTIKGKKVKLVGDEKTETEEKSEEKEKSSSEKDKPEEVLKNDEKMEENEEIEKKSENSEEKTENSEEKSKISEEKTENSEENAKSPEEELKEIPKKEESSEDSNSNKDSAGPSIPNSVENQENPSPETSSKDEAKTTPKSKSEDQTEEETLVEIQDPDDYLLYLESILKLIHEKFYEEYDKSKEIPDLKMLIPRLKSQVLVGVSIVFSGLIPNICKLERSRPYLIAKNLGAQVTENITNSTTHLVAASTGTQKVFQALKNKKIRVVTPDWLWTCAERWERVEEMLFPLSTNKQHKMRQIPAHCSPDRIPEDEDVKFNNPYLQMSDCDIASMEAEVDTTSSSDSDDEDLPPEAERSKRKRKRLPEEEEEPSKVKLNFTKVENEEGSSSSVSGKSGKSSSDEDEESPSTKFRRGEKISSEFEMDSNDSVDSVDQPEDDDDDGEWNMMGAALEREFLGSGD